MNGSDPRQDFLETRDEVVITNTTFRQMDHCSLLPPQSRIQPDETGSQTRRRTIPPHKPPCGRHAQGEARTESEKVADNEFSAGAQVLILFRLPLSQPLPE
jgi:hypothetical protein